MAKNSYWQNNTEEDEENLSASSTSEDESYWRGSLRGLENINDSFLGIRIESAPSRSGSVTARARQLYATEALRSKDHISAGLLAIFLGIFGIHKFYLGCNQAGFIMLAVTIIGGLLTFGLAITFVETIAAIEGIIYLTKSQTDFDHIYVVNQRDWF